MEGNTQHDEAALLAGEEAALLAEQLRLEKLDLNDICNVVAYSVMSLGKGIEISLKTMALNFPGVEFGFDMRDKI